MYWAWIFQARQAEDRLGLALVNDTNTVVAALHDAEMDEDAVAAAVWSGPVAIDNLGCASRVL